MALTFSSLVTGTDLSGAGEFNTEISRYTLEYLT